MTHQKIIIGVDEVGRGSLCSVVTCCAFVRTSAELVRGVTDSKKLNSKKRTNLVNDIHENGRYVIENANETFIDEHNILQATMYAMRKCTTKLFNKLNTDPALVEIIVDGTFNPFDTRFKRFDDEIHCETLPSVTALVKGDSKVYEISCASILAKVYRDLLMKSLHKYFPQYNLEKNAGYGTREHIREIQKRGMSIIHRKTFCEKFIAN